MYGLKCSMGLLNIWGWFQSYFCRSCCRRSVWVILPQFACYYGTCNDYTAGTNTCDCSFWELMLWPLCMICMRKSCDVSRFDTAKICVSASVLEQWFTDLRMVILRGVWRVARWLMGKKKGGCTCRNELETWEHRGKNPNADTAESGSRIIVQWYLLNRIYKVQAIQVRVQNSVFIG